MVDTQSKLFIETRAIFVFNKLLELGVFRLLGMVLSRVFRVLVRANNEFHFFSIISLAFRFECIRIELAVKLWQQVAGETKEGTSKFQRMEETTPGLGNRWFGFKRRVPQRGSPCLQRRTEELKLEKRE